jgi:hypothetical protein
MTNKLCRRDPWEWAFKIAVVLVAGFLCWHFNTGWWALGVLLVID